MQFIPRKGTAVWAAVLLTIPGLALAQDNNSNVAGSDATLANDAIADPAMNDPMAADLGTANGMGTTAIPTADATANDMALASTVEPQREDDDFPWGLLGLLGLAGLMGRKKNEVHHVETRTDRRDV